MHRVGDNLPNGYRNLYNGYRDMFHETTALIDSGASDHMVRSEAFSL